MNLRDLIGVLGHELRTPLAAILGYQELLSDGLYGELSPRQLEPVDRIQQSARQLVHLLDGLQELAHAGGIGNDEIESADTGIIANTLVTRLKPLADSRSVTIALVATQPSPPVQMRLQRFLRAAEIAMIAAIKQSHGRALQLECTQTNGTTRCALHGCGLDPQRDNPELFSLDTDGPPPSAAKMRLAMADATLRSAGGTLRLLPVNDRITLELSLDI
jgi:light-regulated signal transduction histidine kinase (bacteriophytochrome)